MLGGRWVGLGGRVSFFGWQGWEGGLERVRMLGMRRCEGFCLREPRVYQILLGVSVFLCRCGRRCARHLTCKIATRYTPNYQAKEAGKQIQTNEQEDSLKAHERKFRLHTFKNERMYLVNTASKSCS